jgi:putative transposase
MSRFRLLPTLEQEQILLAHCRDARYIWNLAVEQQHHW